MKIVNSVVFEHPDSFVNQFEVLSDDSGANDTLQL